MLTQLLRAFGILKPPPSPAPAPTVSAPVTATPAAALVGPLLDTRGWHAEHAGWRRDGTRIEYAGGGHSSLTSPLRPIPASRVAAIAVELACDRWGVNHAEGRLVVTAYTASGGSIGVPGPDFMVAGQARVDALFPSDAVGYTIALVGHGSFMGGTSDTEPLLPRFVNLCASDAG